MKCCCHLLLKHYYTRKNAYAGCVFCIVKQTDKKWKQITRQLIQVKCEWRGWIKRILENILRHVHSLLAFSWEECNLSARIKREIICLSHITVTRIVRSLANSLASCTNACVFVCACSIFSSWLLIIFGRIHNSIHLTRYCWKPNRHTVRKKDVILE